MQSVWVPSSLEDKAAYQTWANVQGVWWTVESTGLCSWPGFRPQFFVKNCLISLGLHEMGITSPFPWPRAAMSIAGTKYMRVLAQSRHWGYWHSGIYSFIYSPNIWVYLLGQTLGYVLVKSRHKKHGTCPEGKQESKLMIIVVKAMYFKFWKDKLSDLEFYIQAALPITKVKLRHFYRVY